MSACKGKIMIARSLVWVQFMNGMMQDGMVWLLLLRLLCCCRFCSRVIVVVVVHCPLPVEHKSSGDRQSTRTMSARASELIVSVALDLVAQYFALAYCANRVEGARSKQSHFEAEWSQSGERFLSLCSQPTDCTHKLWARN